MIKRAFEFGSFKFEKRSNEPNAMDGKEASFSARYYTSTWAILRVAAIYDNAPFPNHLNRRVISACLT
jgi:hypothetical protein